jgi:hypothetical protein
VVIRKPGKGDYTDPKSYRPIALLSTLGKALEGVMATRISYLVERHSLLPQNHIGGRRKRSCEHALHLLMERVFAACREGYSLVSLLTLDVSGAFDNVDHKRLLHNLRQRRIPEELIRWITSFLSDRTTTMTLLEGPMGTFDLHTGIPQGSPLSPILVPSGLQAGQPGNLFLYPSPSNYNGPTGRRGLPASYDFPNENHPPQNPELMPWKSNSTIASPLQWLEHIIDTKLGCGTTTDIELIIPFAAPHGGNHLSPKSTKAARRH